MEERICNVWDKVEEMNTTIKENVKSKKKNPGTKYSENLGYYEKTKPKNKRK